MLDRHSVLNIALFGTSADPPHAGHRGILTWLACRFDHVAVWASDNPFKPNQSPLADRTRMLQLMVESLQHEQVWPRHRVEIYPSLSHRYSVVTLERSRVLWPRAVFTLAIGADLVRQMPSWYRAEALFQQARVLVFPRPGYALRSEDLETLRQHGARLAIAHPPQQYDISSSAYRQASTAAGVPPAVQDYIHQHHLYPCLESPPRPVSAEATPPQ